MANEDGANNTSEQPTTLTYETLMKAWEMLKKLPKPEPIYLIGHKEDTDKVVMFYQISQHAYNNPFTVKESGFVPVGTAIILHDGKPMIVRTATL